MTLPCPNAKIKYSGDSSPPSVEEVRGIICNPIYAGLGEFPALISDEQWVEAAVKAIEEDGPRQFLVNMLCVLRGSLGRPES